MNTRHATLAEIGEILRQHRRFVVLGHVRPDGDALGSQLALGLSLRAMGKEVEIWNEDGMLDKYSFLPGGDAVHRPPVEPREFDVAVALDTAVQNRLGTTLNAISRADIWINIDHHGSNPGYGDLVHIDSDAPATGQILFDLLKQNAMPLDEAMAINLFAAISTDTGSFQYPKTSARTFEIAAELIQLGVNVGKLSQQLYENFPRRRIELLRELLDTMRFDADGRVASFKLSRETGRRIGALPEDNEGLIDHLRAIEGVIVAAFFEELADGKVRVSLRSKENHADVCAICQQFGGGGHQLAAGARVRGTLDEVEERVLQAICDVLKHNT